MVKRKRWGLYVINERDLSEDERFFFLFENCCLVYSRKKPAGKHAEVKELSILPDYAKEWLSDCVRTVQSEFYRKHHEELLTQAKDFAQVFQQELKREKERIGEVSNGSD